MMARALRAGDRIWVGGGYDPDPGWMTAARGNDHAYRGTVAGFIPGQGVLSAAFTTPAKAAVIELDDEIVLPDGAGAMRGSEIRGRFLVLELGHEGTDWATPRPRIHVELCDFRPEPKPSKERRRGAWVESHATYDYLDDEQQ
jgi:hypothetical protein